MDIDMSDQFDQLDQYLQFAVLNNSNWNLNNSDSTSMANFNDTQDQISRNIHSYQNNAPCHQKQMKFQANSINYDKNLTCSLIPNHNDNHQSSWQEQFQYFPSYQQYLPPRDNEKSYACSNI